MASNPPFSTWLRTFLVRWSDLIEIIWSDRAPTISEAEICSVSQTKAVTKKIFQSVLFNTRFLISSAETIAKMVDRAVHESHSRDMKEASATNAGKKLMIEPSSPHATEPSEIPSDSESLEEPRISQIRFCSSSHRNRHEKKISNGRYLILDTDSDRYFKSKNICNRHSIST